MALADAKSFHNESRPESMGMLIDMEVILIMNISKIYKCKLSTTNPCGSNIMLLLQTWIINVWCKMWRKEVQKC